MVKNDKKEKIFYARSYRHLQADYKLMIMYFIFVHLIESTIISLFKLALFFLFLAMEKCSLESQLQIRLFTISKGAS